MTLAKALGNGLPIGAMLTTAEIAQSFVPGTHASTFGGNPVASAAAVATMGVLTEDGFLEDVRVRGEYFRGELQKLADKYPGLLSGVRGLGMILGLVLTEEGVALGTDIVNSMFDKGFLMNFAGNAVLRFVPPLIVTREEIDALVSGLAEVLRDY